MERITEFAATHESDVDTNATNRHVGSNNGGRNEAANTNVWSQIAHLCPLWRKLDIQPTSLNDRV
jgi:hypothetical protein